MGRLTPILTKRYALNSWMAVNFQKIPPAIKVESNGMSIITQFAMRLRYKKIVCARAGPTDAMVSFAPVNSAMAFK